MEDWEVEEVEDWEVEEEDWEVEEEGEVVMEEQGGEGGRQEAGSRKSNIP